MVLDPPLLVDGLPGRVIDFLEGAVRGWWLISKMSSTKCPCSSIIVADVADRSCMLEGRRLVGMALLIFIQRGHAISFGCESNAQHLAVFQRRRLLSRKALVLPCRSSSSRSTSQQQQQRMRNLLRLRGRSC